MKESWHRTLRAIVLAVFMTAVVAAYLIMAGPPSAGKQGIFMLGSTVAACVFLRSLVAGLAACGTAWLMFTLVAPHLPHVIDSWPH
jgi:hypothetical protein